MRMLLRTLPPIFLAAFALLLGCAVWAATSSGSADRVTGLYWSPEKDAKLRVYHCGGKYCGKLEWVKNNRKDTENPDESLRDRELLGLTILTGFEYDADENEWVDGNIYDPKGGSTYSCTMWLENGGKNLKVRGYVGFSLLGRTETFTRIE